MFPPSQGLNLDIEAISGICGSISIACWVVVFSPQIVENFRRGSADGLSLQFLIVWLAGDVFNILGAVLQGVLPTMIILALYYTFADIVLLGQCFYYRGFTWRDDVIPPSKPTASERTPLLEDQSPSAQIRERQKSTVSATHLSPATPLLDPLDPSDIPQITETQTTLLQSIGMNLLAVTMVCGAGVLGWYLSAESPANRKEGRHQPATPEDDAALNFNLLGQVFGYLCAVLYLGSRIPQLLLNFRRKSTEGVSILFFIFACIGNLTYVLSIFAYEPRCHGHHGKCGDGEAWAIYGQYILINASWLAGSLGTLFLDLGIFAQFFLYRTGNEDFLDEEEDIEAEHRVLNGHAHDERPLLQRGDSVG